MKTPNELPRYYRCRTAGCDRQIVADAPSDWPDDVKERMRMIAQAWPHMWPRTQRRALEELFEPMLWHTVLERLEVVLRAEEGSDDEGT